MGDEQLQQDIQRLYSKVNELAVTEARSDERLLALQTQLAEVRVMLDRRLGDVEKRQDQADSSILKLIWFGLTMAVGVAVQLVMLFLNKLAR